MIYYASHTLNDTQINYTMTKKDFLATIFSFEKFRPYLIGSHFIVFTYNVALKHLLLKRDAKLRLVRWMLFCRSLIERLKIGRILKTLLLTTYPGFYVLGVLRLLCLNASLISNYLCFTFILDVGKLPEN